MTASEIVFFDHWQFLDAPECFFFLDTVLDDGRTILLRNNLIPDAELFVCISDRLPDRELASAMLDCARKERIVFQYAADSSDISPIRELFEGRELRLLNCSEVFVSGRARAGLTPNDDILIREAREEDISALLAMSVGDSAHDYSKQLADAFHDASAEVLVLEYNSSPAVFTALSEVCSRRFDRRYRHISPILTLPEQRRRGLASYLVRWVLERYSDSDFLYVCDSTENLASRRVALSCGFERIGCNIQLEIEKLGGA